MLNIRNIFSTLKTGNIIFVLDIFNETYDAFCKKINTSDPLLFFDKKDFKSRAFLILKNDINEKVLYGFAMQSNKPKYNKYYIVKKIDGTEKYINLNIIYPIKFSQIFSVNIINHQFVLDKVKMADLSKILLNNFLNKTFKTWIENYNQENKLSQ